MLSTDVKRFLDKLPRETSSKEKTTEAFSLSVSSRLTESILRQFLAFLTDFCT